MRKFVLIATTLVTGLGVLGAAIPANAQCAGCSADFNKAERQRMAREAQREAVKEKFGTGMIRVDLDKADNRVKLYHKAADGGQ